MAKTILGLSAFYHDSAACLLAEGRIVAAAQEERFSRKKHDAECPTRAARYCLLEGRLSPEDVGFVAFYDKPLLKFERLLETYIDYAPRGFESFRAAMPLWLTNRLWMEETIRRELGTGGRVLFSDHHDRTRRRRSTRLLEGAWKGSPIKFWLTSSSSGEASRYGH